MRVKHIVWIAVCFLLFFTVYNNYSLFLFKVLEWQKSFNQQISAAMTGLSENRQQAGITLLIISFLYGVFHAVGPGHGKFILTGYLSLEKTKLNQAMKISFLSALAQGFAAITLVSIIVVAFTLSRSYFNLTLKWVERGSFVLMILFGIYWCYQALKAFKRKSDTIPKIQRISAINLQKNSKITPLIRPQKHLHTENCGCGHQHLPSSTQIHQAKDWKAQAMVILSIGARPCSGAILVLFLAYTLDIYAWGMLSALAMAIGTGMTLTLFAWLVIIARNRAIRLSTWYISEQTSRQAMLILKILVGMILVIFGVTLFHSSFIETSGGAGLFKR
ncbi:ABC transporter permease [Actinobacillus lignieresii]|uniref:nickel/cobalt transporter n=1 Tax=Actinobacillus lignieresii TaxID=720 RepID=UPI000F71455C|nr:nickel/cobalt transporter [Actinobacillus lignieresii]VEB26286.1 ABC transporter permease [Actinobacillus lignieresii]